MKTIIERIAVAVSMIWNMYIVAGFVLGASYALHRAAGGAVHFIPDVDSNFVRSDIRNTCVASGCLRAIH